MKTSTLAWAVVLLLALAGIVYWGAWMGGSMAPANPPIDQTTYQPVEQTPMDASTTEPVATTTSKG